MIFPFFTILLFISGLIQQQTNACGCVPVKTSAEMYRIEAKYEKEFSKYPEHPGIIAPETVRSWEKTYRHKMNRLFDETPRVKETPEDSLYTLSGYIYQAKMNKNDCDLHLEIGPEDPAALRMAAEITKDNCKLQEEILRQLQAKGFVIGKQNPAGIKCTLKGLGFHDGKHPLKENKKREKGSAWEIHPVMGIELK